MKLVVPKRVILFACFSSFLSLPAFGNGPLPIGDQQVGLDASTVQKVSRTTFKMIDDTNDSHCTVAVISPEGEMFTALHCVLTCLAKNGALEHASNTYIGLQNLIVPTRSKNTAVFCPNLSVPGLGAKGLTIVATGSALSDFDHHFLQNFPSLHQELKAQGFASRANDFAILKVDSKKPLACLKLAPQRLKNDVLKEKIWALGFPLLEDVNAAVSLSASVGHIYKTPIESHHFKSKSVVSEKRYTETVYSGPGILFSDAQTNLGQSGGPVIDSTGGVIGIVSGFTNTTTATGDVHELVAGSTNFVLGQLPVAEAKALLKRSQRCQ